ncbi:MAG: BACON domain-containing protein [Bacteroidaceae bacterium]|nr:BACON domain-containing protein [Bacteroidaceae bacterium]
MKSKFIQYYNKVISFVLKMLGFSSTFVLAACYGPPPEDYQLDVFPGHLDFSAEGDEKQNVMIMTEGDWTISCTSSFVHVSYTPGYGSTSVSVLVEPNNSTMSRSSSIVVSNRRESAIVTISQQGMSPQFSVSPTSLSFSGEVGDTRILTVKSNTAWVISNVPEWLSVSSTYGKRGDTMVTVVTTQENRTDMVRKDMIVVQGSESKSNQESVFVVQNPL